jgi:hypothetical protein
MSKIIVQAQKSNRIFCFAFDGVTCFCGTNGVFELKELYLFFHLVMAIFVGRGMRTGEWVISFTLSPTEGGWRSVLLMPKVMTKLLLVTRQLHSG